MTATIATTARTRASASRPFWSVHELRDELAVLTSGAVRISEATTLDEARAFAWDLAVEMLWLRPVAPLFCARGGLSAIVEDAAVKAWNRWND